MPFRPLARTTANIAANLAARISHSGWAILRALATSVVSGVGRGSRRPPSSDALGRRGERAAERTLRRRGYRILARRLRTKGGEVDLVAVDGETVVLVEVKASVARPAGERPTRAAADRVDSRKRGRLAGASAVLRRGALAGRPHRIDVASVVFVGRRADVTVVRGAVRAARGEERSDRG